MSKFSLLIYYSQYKESKTWHNIERQANKGENVDHETIILPSYLQNLIIRFDVSFSAIISTYIFTLVLLSFIYSIIIIIIISFCIMLYIMLPF